MPSKQKIIKILKAGGIGVMPTDTIFGLVGLALNKKAVERIYRVRKRAPDKPFIILISALSDLKKFEIKIDAATKKFLSQLWPNELSIILPCSAGRWHYLHRGAGGLAFRLPKKKSVLEVLKKTGPLVAPSVNPESLEPAKNIKEAKDYFGESLDFYYGQGSLDSLPSTLIKIENNKIRVLRQGKVLIKK